MPMSYGFLSTYTPTECGLATFTAALVGELKRPPASRVGVVRVLDRLERSGSRDVVHHLVTTSPGGEAEAAAILDGFDAVVVQHEYGIYGGPDGDQVLEVLERLSVPVIVVLHTVLVEPTPHQREVLERVLAVADAVVTMTPTARRRLLDFYPVDPARVALIPHGAPDNRLPGGRRDPAAPDGGPSGARPTILTWGLLGPGKGIEWVIEALGDLVDLDPQPRYRVVGETHPRVVEQCGEAYRHRLMKQAAQQGVAHLVEFDDGYFATADLGRIVAAADVVVLPYDSPEQVTSGVLVEALAAGKPVIATGFPHAVELLAGGVGLIVPHRDPAAIAAALRRVLTEPELAAGLGAAAAAVAPQLLWPAVAARYRSLAVGLVQARDAAVA